jgi:hypothetical protein
VAALLAIDPHVVYYWQRRFKADGLLGLSTRPRERTLISYMVAARTRCVRRHAVLSRCGLGAFHRIRLGASGAACGDQGSPQAPAALWQGLDVPSHLNPPQSARALGAPARD